jgi:hypothetical protein
MALYVDALEPYQTVEPHSVGRRRYETKGGEPDRPQPRASRLRSPVDWIKSKAKPHRTVLLRPSG